MSNAFRDWWEHIIFALTKNPTERRRDQLKAQINEADKHRAKGERT